MTSLNYSDGIVSLWNGDCLDVLRLMPDEHVDAIVTDPPYGLGFMGEAWDDLPPGLPWAKECLRVLKPGGHLLAFGGTRTWHRLAVAVEDAGFEVRDSIAWLYGSGFPKSLDVSKAIDKVAVSLPLWDAVRDHLRHWQSVRGLSNRDLNIAVGGAANGGGRASAWLSEAQQKPELPNKAQWARLREALSWDHCELDEVYAEIKDGATRPVVDTRSTSRSGGTWSGHESAGMFRAGDVAFDITAPATPSAQQWAGWGTALKPAFEPIVVARKPLVGTVAANVLVHGTGALNIDGTRVGTGEDKGVWPVTDRGREPGWGMKPAAETDTTQGRWPANVLLDGDAAAELDEQADASRFFPTFKYQAKAPTRERPTVVAEDGTKTAHPTVKPLALMRWLVRLVTPPGGVVLDPFAGSGTTIEAAVMEGFQVIGIEREADYLPLIEARIARNRITDEGLPAAADALALFDLEESA